MIGGDTRLIIYTVYGYNFMQDFHRKGTHMLSWRCIAWLCRGFCLNEISVKLEVLKIPPPSYPPSLRFIHKALITVSEGQILRTATFTKEPLVIFFYTWPFSTNSCVCKLKLGSLKKYQKASPRIMGEFSKFCLVSFSNLTMTGAS